MPSCRRSCFRSELGERDKLQETLAALATIADIAEGSTTANSLPHIARIAREVLARDEQKEGGK